MMNEFEYELQIVEGNEASIETDILTGKLLSLVVETSRQMAIEISIPSLNLVLYAGADLIVGTNYLPIRQMPLVDNALLLHNSIPFDLNDRARIEINGMQNTNVRVRIRLEE
jgi:hypothetical protein